MEQKTFTNAQIVSILDGLSNQKGRAMREKKFPFRLLYAMRRSVPEVEKAYRAYNDTLQDICKKYDVTPAEAGRTDNAECKAEVTALLEMEVAVSIHTVQPIVLRECDDERYSALTFDDLDRLWWLVADEDSAEE